MRGLILGGCVAVGVAGCAMNDGGMDSVAGRGGARAAAALTTSSGQAAGTVTAIQAGDSIEISLDGMALPVGVHAAHVHSVGRCDAPGFESAGPHWNPTGVQHGSDNPAGAHKGDLPNFTVAADGRGRLTGSLAGSRLTGGTDPLLDADGAAFVIHAAADDYRTDPSGNSGARIACGIFR